MIDAHVLKELLVTPMLVVFHLSLQDLDLIDRKILESHFDPWDSENSWNFYSWSLSQLATCTENLGVIADYSTSLDLYHGVQDLRCELFDFLIYHHHALETPMH